MLGAAHAECGDRARARSADPIRLVRTGPQETLTFAASTICFTLETSSMGSKRDAARRSRHWWSSFAPGQKTLLSRIEGRLFPRKTDQASSLGCCGERKKDAERGRRGDTKKRILPCSPSPRLRVPVVEWSSTISPCPTEGLLSHSLALACRKCGDLRSRAAVTVGRPCRNRRRGFGPCFAALGVHSWRGLRGA